MTRTVKIIEISHTHSGTFKYPQKTAGRNAMSKHARSYFLSISVFFAFMFVTGCSVSHETMRGSVLIKLDNEAHICIGKDEGIQVEDILVVYRIKVDGQWWLLDYQQRYPTAALKKINYQKVKVGEVKVTEIFSERFAAVRLISGELQGGDIVEKRWFR